MFIPTGEQQLQWWNIFFLSQLGFQSKQLIVDYGLRLGDVDQYPTIDVTIDGADECVILFYLVTTDLRSHMKGRSCFELCQRWRSLSLARKSTCGSCQNVSEFIFYLNAITNTYSVYRFILVADYRKNVQYLGTNVRKVFFFFFLCTTADFNLVCARGTNRSHPLCLCKSVAESPPYPWITESHTSDGSKERLASFFPTPTHLNFVFSGSCGYG